MRRLRPRCLFAKDAEDAPAKAMLMYEGSAVESDRVVEGFCKVIKGDAGTSGMVLDQIRA